MRLGLTSCFLFMIVLASAQHFTKQDTLRGSITPERSWWDLVYYHLDIEVLPEQKKIKGSNTIHYKVIEPYSVLQIDLQPPLRITRVVQGGEELSCTSYGNAHFVKLNQEQPQGSVQKIRVDYEGHPKEAIRPPWDGGISWKKDENGQPFIASSCQGLGASVWWPCKDHMYDEVDSMLISVEVPEDLVNVSNGKLVGVDHHQEKKTKTYHWSTSNPINNYGVNINIGDYVNWKETYAGEKGELDVAYWPLRQDEEKAREQFQDVPRMLKAFEHWFGPYPFYEDGYKLVQVPYLGMEHQSSVTYGNQFMNGYKGEDLSDTGWGLKFDFIIIHESGHEWFANNITHRDMADMWIHEGFTNYSESLFVEYYYGKEAGQEYVRGVRSRIGNRKPIIGPYDVNYQDYPGDVYYKGSNILNTLRTWVDDDEKWRGMLRDINQYFYHRTISSNQLEARIAEYFQLDLRNFFDQYLRDPRVPILEYFFKEGQVHYRWGNAIDGFDMPVDVVIGEQKMRLSPTTFWNDKLVEGTKLTVDPNYYVGVMQIR